MQRMARALGLALMGAWMALAAAGAAAREFDVAPAPGWVLALPLRLDAPAPSAQTQAGIHHLLVDRQVKVDVGRRVSYQRTALRALDERGVENAAHVEIDFDPSYQRLVLHHVRLLRGVAVLDRLDPRRMQVLQREKDLEALVFNGTRTASLVLEDVRPGDVVDYAYSLSGQHPSFGERQSGGFGLQWNVPVAQVHARLLWPRDRPLQVKVLNQARAAQVTQGPTHREYVWQQADVAGLSIEQDAPAWYDPYPSILWSEYADWASVVAWARPLYATPARLPANVQAEVDRIAARSGDPSERLMDVLRFVQGEIRYLAVAIGTGSYAPHPSEVVLRRRFGDCKDKTLLALTMLRSLGFDAAPALVNTQRRDALRDVLPSPAVFDHVLLRVTLEGKPFWLDPTRAVQPSVLEEVAQDDFGLALVVEPGQTGLSPMAGEQARRERRKVTAVIDARQGPAASAGYTVTTEAWGGAAEVLRATLRFQRRDELEKRYLAFYAGFFPGLEAAGPIEVHDDPQRNHFKMVEHYRIPKWWHPVPSLPTLAAQVEVPDLSEATRAPGNTHRQAPLALRFPLELEHVTQVQLPPGWDLQPARAEVRHAAFQWNREVGWSGNTLRVSDRFVTLRATVAPHEMSDYVSHLDQVRRRAGYQLRSADPFAPQAATSPHWLPMTFGVAVLLGLCWGAWQGLRWDPEAPGQPHRGAEPQGLGGWLAVLGITLVAGLFAQLRHLSDARETFGVQAWTALTTPGSEPYHPMWMPTLLLEIVIMLLATVGLLLALVLYLRRRSSFPPLLIALLWTLVVLNFIDTVCASFLPTTEASAKSWGVWVRSVIAVMLWTAYLRRSVRVRHTFVRRRGRSAEPSTQGMPA